jgi:hypothetical protein
LEDGAVPVHGLSATPGLYYLLELLAACSFCMPAISLFSYGAFCDGEFCPEPGWALPYLHLCCLGGRYLPGLTACSVEVDLGLLAVHFIDAVYLYVLYWVPYMPFCLCLLFLEVPCRC